MTTSLSVLIAKTSLEETGKNQHGHRKKPVDRIEFKMMHALHINATGNRVCVVYARVSRDEKASSEGAVWGRLGRTDLYIVDSEVLRDGTNCSGRQERGMACMKEPSQQSIGVIPENRGKPKSGCPDREIEPGPYRTRAHQNHYTTVAPMQWTSDAVPGPWYCDVCTEHFPLEKRANGKETEAADRASGWRSPSGASGGQAGAEATATAAVRWNGFRATYLATAAWPCQLHSPPPPPSPVNVTFTPSPYPYTVSVWPSNKHRHASVGCYHGCHLSYMPWEVQESQYVPFRRGRVNLTPPLSPPTANTSELSHLSGHSAQDNAEMRGRGKRDVPVKTRRPAASSGTIPTCENPGATPLEIKPGSP
ncbi:hypothetical protein PR048_004830 [Dryococelus australis]|uniref:Uncharacterized protein n=1 Tax=Dryococelus australis TaxID=614101 RepID=A0ABQ9I6K0_9NEOP|nr:hypothetical protein PR048_004830 [Dryococelus australis]